MMTYKVVNGRMFGMSRQIAAGFGWKWTGVAADEGRRTAMSTIVEKAKGEDQNSETARRRKWNSSDNGGL